MLFVYSIGLNWKENKWKLERLPNTLLHKKFNFFRNSTLISYTNTNYTIYFCVIDVSFDDNDCKKKIKKYSRKNSTLSLYSKLRIVLIHGFHFQNCSLTIVSK